MVGEEGPALGVRHALVPPAGDNEYYQVAVKETVDGLSQVAYVQVDIEGPLFNSQ
jgi:hypothetical protein